jgi:hypothetical protein
VQALALVVFGLIIAAAVASGAWFSSLPAIARVN